MSGFPVAPSGLGELLARVGALDSRLRSLDPGWQGLAGEAFGAVLAGGTGTGAQASAIATVQPATTSAAEPAATTPVASWTPGGRNLTTISWAAQAPSGSSAPAATGGPIPRTRSLPTVAPGSLVNPVPGARVSLPFGPTDFALEPPATVNGIHYAHYHDGLDLAAPLGTPVLAAADGTVIAAGRVADGAVIVRIRHADGSETLYGHLDPDLLVGVGDTVTAGQPIGAIGLTGKTTGPHLHLEYVVDGVNVDPAAAFAPAATEAAA